MSRDFPSVYLNHLMDDLLIMAATLAEASEASDGLSRLLRKLGIPENLDKKDPPTMENGSARYTLIYLGFLINTINMTLKLPAEKVHGVLRCCVSL